MTQNTNVVKLMVKHHYKIEELLDKFEANIESNYESMLKLFNDFEWELEKHIFIEERVIYTQYSPEEIVGGYKMLPKLTTQHNFIINKLQNWNKDIRSKKKILDFSVLKEFIINHKNFEEKEVYPLIDQVLNEEQKQDMVIKINEIIGLDSIN